MCGAKFGIDNVTKSLCLSRGVEGVTEGVIVLFTAEDGICCHISLGSLLEGDLGIRHAQRAVEGDLMEPGVWAIGEHGREELIL